MCMGLDISYSSFLTFISYRALPLCQKSGQKVLFKAPPGGNDKYQTVNFYNKLHFLENFSEIQYELSL